MRNRKGFTLMELMMVIAIIMILAGAIVARVSTTGERAKVAKATAELEELASACRAFNLDTGLWPIDVQSLITKPIEGLNEDYGSQAIPVDSWRGPYIEVETAEVPKDPWDEAYRIDNSGKKLYVKAGALHEDIELLVHLYNE